MVSLSGIWDLLKGVKPAVREEAAGVIEDTKNRFKSLKDEFLEVWFIDLFDQVTNTFEWLIVPTNTLLERTGRKFPQFTEALDALVDEIPKLPERLLSLVSDLGEQAKTQFEDFREQYFDIWFNDFFDQITNVHTWLSPEIATIKTKVKEGFPDLQNSFSNALGGLEKGVSNSLVEGFRDLLDPEKGLAFQLFGPKGFDVDSIKGSLTKFGKSNKVTEDTDLVQMFLDAITHLEDESGFLDFSGLVSGSFTDPDSAREEAQRVRKAIVGAQLGLGALGVVVELASLGQVEGITTMAVKMLDNLSWSAVAQQIPMMEHQSRLLTPYQYWLNKKYTPNIPGPSDLVNFLVRETMTRDRFNELMAFQGFQPEFTEAYWDAHWRLPGTNQVYEMLQRGVPMPMSIEEYLTIADIKEEWRAPLIAISYNPITRVDLRRLYQGGELDEAGMAKRLEFTGLSPADAVLVARAQVLQARSEELGLTLTNLKQDRVEGWLTDLEYQASLTALELPPNELAFRVADTEHDRDRDIRQDRLKLYQEGFRKDMITADQYRGFLLEEGLEAENIDMILASELIRKGENIFTEVS